MAVCGVRVSPVIVTGRQKRDESELKRAKASWSSVETVDYEVSLGFLR